MVENAVNHNAVIGASDCEPLIQEITDIDTTTANSAQQRQGDRIKPKSLKVSGLVSLNQAYPTQSNQPIMVRLIIASQKDVKLGSSIKTGNVIDTAHLLKPSFAATGSDEQSFAGLTQDLLYPINKDKFRVYMDRIIKLTPVVSNGSKEQNSGYVYRYSYRFKQLPSFLTYDDGSGDWCNNFAPFITIGYAYTDNSNEEPTNFRVQHNCFSLLEFEDS